MAVAAKARTFDSKTWARAVRDDAAISPHAKTLAAWLAVEADDGGLVKATVNQLRLVAVTDAGRQVSNATIKRRRKELTDAGWLELAELGGGGRGAEFASKYQLLGRDEETAQRVGKKTAQRDAQETAGAQETAQGATQETAQKDVQEREPFLAAPDLSGGAGLRVVGGSRADHTLKDKDQKPSRQRALDTASQRLEALGLSSLGAVSVDQEALGLSSARFVYDPTARALTDRAMA